MNKDSNNGRKNFRIGSKHQVYMDFESKNMIELCISEVVLQQLYREHYLSKPELDATIAYLRKQ